MGAFDQHRQGVAAPASAGAPGGRIGLGIRQGGVEPGASTPVDLDEEVRHAEPPGILEEELQPTAILQHALRALAEHPESARARSRRGGSGALLCARCFDHGGGFGAATGDEKCCGENQAGGDAGSGSGRQGGARLTDGWEPNNAAPLNRRASSRTLPRGDGGPAVTKSGSAGKSGVRRALHALLAALLCLGTFAEVGAEEVGTAAAPSAPGGSPAPAGAGAELRAGVAALEAGDAERAARLFATVASHYPIVADHADRLRMRALLALSRYADVADLASGFEGTYPDSPLRGEVLRMLGDARSSLADAAAARAAWQRARAEARDDETRAELDLSIAESFESSGRDSEASRAYLAVWSGAPTSPAAGAAEEALERLEARSGIALRTPPEFAKRARAFFAARANQEALVSYDRALDGNLPGKTRRELQRERAFTLFRLRRYPEAAEAFTQVGGDTDARFWRARSLARSGRVDQSIRELEELAKGRFSVLAAQSLFLAGLLREDEADRTRATASFVRVASKAPSRRLRAAARWRLGWCAYLDGRHREAAEHFAALLAATSDPLERLSARYWKARSLEKLGAAEAAQEFRAIASEYPLSYYGWRSASRIERGSLRTALPARSPPSPVSFSESAIERVAILIEAGLLEDARIETELLAGKARSLEDRLEIADLSSAAEDYHRAERAVVDPYGERLARGPEPGRESLWWFAWPLAFSEQVEAATRGRNVPPALLNAVMREESGFRPGALSTAGARGLTQIMPATAERLAESLGLPGLEPEDLFTPAQNLLLGAHYLEQLLERFDGRISAAVASYNAGPAAVERWIEKHPDLEDDEWVEAIPFDQTRAYVKRVLRSQQAYEVLY
jgi:soluble lytic murein transglycosylase